MDGIFNVFKGQTLNGPAKATMHVSQFREEKRTVHDSLTLNDRSRDCKAVRNENGRRDLESSPPRSGAHVAR